MSHNKIKVGGQSPNSSGEISLNLENLNDVQSVSNKSILSYNGSTWAGTSLSKTNKEVYYRFFKNSPTDYGTSKNFSNGDAYVWIGTGFSINQYIHGSVTVINANSSDTPVGSGWRQGVRLGTAGTYLIIFCATLDSGSMDFRLHDGSNFFGVKGQSIGDSSNKNNLIWAIKTVSANTTIKALVSNVSSAGLPESQQATGVTISFYKIG